MELYKRYRPTSWSEFIGNEKEVGKIRWLVEREGFDGGAIWINGPSGVGKTTLAYLIANAVGCHPDSVIEIDGDECNTDRVHKLKEELRYRPMFGTWRVIIVDEAHLMSSKAVQTWLRLLEKHLPRNVVVIFATSEGTTGTLFAMEGGNPFGSRVKEYTLTSYGAMKGFATLAKQIAERENLDGQPIAKYAWFRTARTTCGSCSNGSKWAK
jgi:replication-associated recombination protein RarA